MIAGLEKHTDLQGYIDKIERRKIERETEDIKLQLGLCTEYIVGQYLKEYPLCVGEDLFSNIENLKEVLSEETVNLLHSLRKARNDGGAHISKGKKYTFEETIELYNELLNYLPDFLKVFPTPSEKPEPKAGAAANLDFVIDFESIQPIELHPNWRECIGYNDMLKFKAMPQFNEYIQKINDENEDTEIFYWLWCVILTDRLNLIVKNGEKEYLDIKQLVKYYYEALQKNKCDYWMQMPNGYEGTYYIPAIIREYFPNDLARFWKGKGYEWTRYETLFGENWEHRRYKTVSALVNGEIAIVKQAIAGEIHWYTVGKAEMEEKERQAAIYKQAQQVQAKKREEAREAARIAQEKKEYEERVKKNVEKRNEEIKEYKMKGIKAVAMVALIPLSLLAIIVVLAIVKNIFTGGFVTLFKIFILLLLLAIIGFRTWRKIKNYFK